MKPSNFEYYKPGSVQEAIELLVKHGYEAKLLAGGQSLVPMMNFRVARPEVLVDLNGITELAYIREEGDRIAIGALTRERDVEISPIVKEKCPLLAGAISNIGHVPIRCRGTIGGSLAHADPSAEIPTATTALGATFKVAGPDGVRELTAGELFLTYLTTSLEPAEIIVEARIPVMTPEMGWSFLELNRRHGDFAIVGVATLLTMAADGTCKEARIAVGGVGPVPMRAEKAEALLAGKVLTDELIDQAGALAAQEAEPDSDYHASADYREDLTRVYVCRGLRAALKQYKERN